MLGMSLIGSSCTVRNVRTPESTRTPVPPGKPIWPARSKFLRNKSLISHHKPKPINKRFPLHPIATTV